MEYRLENDTLIITCTGKIDSANATAFGKEIGEIRQANPHSALVLDFSDIMYISSAGLRQLLTLNKAEGSLSIIDVAPEVYDIFDMTGFNQILDVRKPYRNFSVDGCEIIGEGSNGIVYRINSDTIIKVFRNANVLDDIKKERRLAQKALIMGVNTAISYDVVKVGDKYGSVFELLGADCLSAWMRKDPDHLDKYIEILADFARTINSIDCTGQGLPSNKDTAISWVKWLEGRIDQDKYDKLLALVTAVPDDNHMNHGDYHSNNIHYDGNEPIIIDMDTLSVGNPVFELGSVYNAYVGFSEYDHESITHFLKLPVETGRYIWHKFLSLYCGTTDEDELATIETKVKVISYTRLLRRTMKREPDKTELIDFYKKRLYDCIDAVDSIAL